MGINSGAQKHNICGLMDVPRLFCLFSFYLFVVVAQTPESGIITFTPFVNDDCTGTPVANVTLPTGVCLNDHDFNKVSCSVLTNCLSGNSLSYEDLVSCSGAPAMSLSINITAYNDGSFVVHAFPLSKKCFGVPVPIPEEVGGCSTLFALNKECYPSGAFGFIW
uniref:Uncharacterized protein n=1 Tax=Vannella robusta TaxID=1487602 RepID=A0A7S4I218_9EUKA|mmetsp:Transcript_19321/g.24428  ORF Transcript_19321/g.24428 Transcript_19321/m.24428 type:complete len:164 (+) Transcript_19321:109-600(+)